MHPLLEVLIFLLAILISFYLPGKYLLTKLKLSLGSPEDLFLPFVFGAMIFTLITYILSWLKLEIVILPILLIISLYVIKNKKWILNSIDKQHLLPLFLVIVMAIIFSFSMLVAGVYGDSIKIRHDDLWHLALINELRSNFPPDNPGFAEIPLKGYHFFYNFLLAKIANTFFISPLSLYFHFFPLLVAILWGLGVYSFMYKWSKKISIALWAVFLTMFGGSFAFTLKLRGHEGLSLDSAFGILQPISSLINPPFSMSIVIIIAVLFSLHQYLQRRERGWLAPIALCIGLVTMFKVYAGIILMGSFVIIAFIQFLRRKFLLTGALILTGILFYFTYWILADHQAKLIFYPLWAPHDVLNSNMPWYGYAEKMYTYTKLNVVRGIVETELYSLSVFIFGNLGTRLIGLLALLPLLLRRKIKLSFFAFTVLIMALISILMPLFFIQSGKVFEIIQMAWYFLFFISLFAAFGLQMLLNIFHKRLVKIILFSLILVVTLPSAYENYKGYFDLFTSQGSKLSDPYFRSMQFLQSKGTYDDTVLEIPKRSVLATQIDVLRWYKSSNPSIAAFANKRTYFNNEYIDFAGTDYNLRADFIRKIILLHNMSVDNSEYTILINEVRQGLEDNNVSFIYSPYPLSFEKNISNVRKVFENQSAVIYAVGIR